MDDQKYVLKALVLEDPIHMKWSYDNTPGQDGSSCSIRDTIQWASASEKSANHIQGISNG